MATTKVKAKTKAAGDYSEDNISYFETELQKVRAKPQMYIGPTDGSGIFTITREPCDNGVDEARAGRNKLVHIFITSKDHWVVDAGVGIPVKKHSKAKISTLTHVLTALQSSGKMSGDAYKSAIGCFTGETQIELVDGRSMTIGDMYSERSQGKLHYVWAIDRKTGNVRPQAVDRVIFTGWAEQIVQVTLSDGSTFRCTPNHPLYTNANTKVPAIDSLGCRLAYHKHGTDSDSVVELAFGTSRPLTEITKTYDFIPDNLTDEDAVQFFDLEEYHENKNCLATVQLGDASDASKERRLYQYKNPYAGVPRLDHEIFVTDVQYVQLDEPVGVYDLSVGIDHNYQLACGVFVGNTHGVGIKATNALSAEFEVWTYRADAGGWHYTKFERGVEKVAVKKVAKAPKLPDGKTPKLGTVIRFVPDDKIFLKAKLNPSQLRTWCEMTSYMNAGLTVRLTDPKGKTQEWMSKLGISEYLDKRLTDLKATALNKKPLFHTSDTMELALSFADVEGTEVQFFTNTIRNVDEGFHAESFYKALAKSLDPYKGKLVYTPSDLKEGLVGILNYKIDAPQFSSQTKEKLVDVRMKEPCYAECLEVLSEYWKNNKTLAKEIVTRAAELRKKTSDFLKDKKLIKNVKGATKALSTKMADVTNNKIPFSERELYLVEGDSAGGCHFGDVRVKLVDGTTKSFEELVADFAKGIDHKGLAYDRTNKVPVPFTFFHPRITKYVTEYIEMELADGTVWRGTVDHPWLLTNGTYKAAGKLTPDDEIQEVQP